MEQIAHHCDRAILLEHGSVAFIGKPPEAIHRYLTLVSGQRGQEKTPGNAANLSSGDMLIRRPNYNPAETRWGDRAATIIDACLVQNGIENPPFLFLGARTELKFWSTCHADSEKLVFGIAIKSCTGAMVLATNSRFLLGPNEPLKQMAGSKLCTSFFFMPLFEPGDYLVSIGVTSESDGGLLAHDRRYDSIILNLRAPQPNDENSNASLSCRIDTA
jgi:lipopolysaccharide transport system ATP-binding protein